MQQIVSMMNRQRGSVLIVALVFMLLLTIIGVGAMQSSVLQERMAGGARDLNNAFQAAEAAVRTAEAAIDAGGLGAFNGSGGRYLFCSAGQTGTACAAPNWRDRASTGWVTRPGTLESVNAQPQYIIEFLQVEDPSGSLDADAPVTKIDLYRITARGFGISDGSMVVLQTMYRP